MRAVGFELPRLCCPVAQIVAVESGGPDAVAKLETELGAKTALPRIIKAGYRGLQLIHFFTAGEDEVKAWTIRVRACCVLDAVALFAPCLAPNGFCRLFALPHARVCSGVRRRCWLSQAGTKAPQAAGVIHTDFEHGFIRAEVQAFDDFKERAYLAVSFYAFHAVPLPTACSWPACCDSLGLLRFPVPVSLFSSWL